MEMKAGMRWIVMVVAFGMIPLFGMPEGSLAQSPETLVCINCHTSWLDNNPANGDVATRNAHPDYVPLNLNPLANPFYSIKDGYLKSGHGAGDYPTCQGCHGNQFAAHGGTGTIPSTQTCLNCHGNPDPSTDPFLATRHANLNALPGKFFDQLGISQTAKKAKKAKKGKKGKKGSAGAATGFLATGEPILLLNAGGQGVTSAQRVEECSVCHNYALLHPQLSKKIAQGTMPDPQVGCAACHQAHMPGPAGNQLAQVSTKVQVTKLSGSTVLDATPVDSPVSYPNHRPYKVDETGAQNFAGGTWTRGSAIARPSTAIVTGKGSVTIGSTSLSVTEMTGSLTDLKPGHPYTLFISGTATGSGTLPAAAINAGAQVTVQAALDKYGYEYEVEEGTAQAGATVLTLMNPVAVSAATVTYNKPQPGGGTGTLSVPFTGQVGVDFEIRDMYTNSEALCASCHTQGTLKFTAKGKKADGTIVLDAGRTHNKDIMTQFRNSGHGDRSAPPWEEFTAFGGHQMIWPYDMSVSGSGGVDSYRIKGNRTYSLTETPDAANAYLVTANNTTQWTTAGSYSCMQCHNGLTSINYQKNVQGTPAASVVWGDTGPTCITCHEPHSDPNGTGKNVRVPVQLSFNSALPGGGFNKFLDGTSLPAGLGDSAICLFCHQGRESGLTVYKAIRDKNVDPYVTPTAAIAGSFSFKNPHYLEGGAILWSRNAYEFPNKTYTEGNPMHQTMNCVGCHMGEANADNTEGGHTWNARIETCQQCHLGAQSFETIRYGLDADYDGDQLTETMFEEIGSLVFDAAGNRTGGTGLLNALAGALESQGIYYRTGNPYFFKKNADGTFSNFTSWKVNQFVAAFNLQYANKAEGGAFYHNPKYVVQILRDSIEAATGAAPGGVRPATDGERPATNYATVLNNP
jgi:nitrate/TMAO reductase-like tetraheme cytochrome c subunit